jgi:hypothetical protein
MTQITFERYLTERRAIPPKALEAALVLCMYDVEKTGAIMFGMSLYGSMHRAIFDPTPETRHQIEVAYHALSKSLGYGEDELESNGAATLLPDFLENGKFDPAYELPFQDYFLGTFVQMAKYHLEQRIQNPDFLISTAQDKYADNGETFIYAMRQRRRELVKNIR